jgi:hypothetical protein
MGVIYILLSIVAALFFYGLRGRRPFVYGLIEFAVGLIGLTLTFYPQTSYLLIEESSFWGMTLSHDVTIVGGIYLLVRGLDNMDRDLPLGWRHHWDILFLKRNT